DFERDRHGQPVGGCQGHEYAGAPDALGHLSKLANDLFDRTSKCKRFSDAAAWTERSEARRDQIARACETGERLRIAAERRTEAGELGQPTRDHDRARAVARI